MPNRLKQTFSLVKEILQEVFQPKVQDDENSEEFRKELPPLMGVTPIAWIGRYYYFDDHHDHDEKDIKKKKMKKKKNHDEENWKNTNGREKYFVRQLNDWTQEGLGRNCLITHLLVAVEVRRKSVKFGLLKMGKKGSIIDEKRLIMLNESVELNSFEIFFIRNQKERILEFTALYVAGWKSVASNLMFELNENQVELSRVTLVSSAEFDFASTHERVLYPIRTENESTTTQCYHTFCTENPKLYTAQIENGEAKLIGDQYDFKHCQFVYAFQRMNRITGKIEHYALAEDVMDDDYKWCEEIGIYRLEDDKATRIENIEIIPQNLKDEFSLKHAIPFTETLLLLVYDQSLESDDNIGFTTVDEFFCNGILWIIFDLESFTIRKISPISHPINKNKKKKGDFVIDGNFNEKLEHNQLIPIREIGGKFASRQQTACLLRPFGTNSELFFLELFTMKRRDMDEKDTFGRVFTFCFRIPINSLFKDLEIIPFCDVNVECQQ